MTKRIPLLSVIMPAYNSESHISMGIESILKQTFTNFELIIVNDASTDRTFAISKKYASKDRRIRIVTNKHNVQIAQSLNIGIQNARAEIIARMDTDDISDSERFAIQYEFLKNHPGVAIVGANIDIIDKDGRVVGRREYKTSYEELKKLMFRYSPLAHPAIMFRKRIFSEFGGYDTKMVPCEDIDLWFKIGSKYSFANIPKILLQYRLVAASNSNSRLRYLELLGFRIKFHAIWKYGYRPSLYDVAFNIMQFTTLWFMPAKYRIWLYNFLRGKGII